MRPRSPKLPPIQENQQQSQQSQYQHQQGNQSQPRLRVTNLKELEKQMFTQKKEYLNQNNQPNKSVMIMDSHGKFNKNSTSSFQNKQSSFSTSKNYNYQRSKSPLLRTGIHNNSTQNNTNITQIPIQQIQGNNNTTILTHQQRSITYNGGPLNNLTTMQEEQNSSDNIIYNNQKVNNSQNKTFIPTDQSNIKPSQLSQQDLKNLQANKLIDILKESGITSNAQINQKQNQYLFDGLKVDTKKFYQERKPFLKIMTEFDITSSCFEEVNQRVKCYRYELGSVLEQVSYSFQLLIEKLFEETVVLYHETKSNFEYQLNENLDKIEMLEKEKKSLMNESQELKNKFTVQESLLKIMKVNTDALNDEITILNEMLKKDILNMVNHLGTMESQQSNKIQALKEDNSDNIVFGLKNLDSMIQNIEQEQIDNQESLQTMKGLIKAMLKGSKQDVQTQVDEADLQWDPQMVIIGDTKKNILSAEEIEAMSIGINEKYISEDTASKTNKDILIAKEKELNAQKKTYQNQENWNLSVTLIIFLENITKMNETGRVIPWLHFRKAIFDIYNDRIENSWEISGSLNTTTVNFDEYVCIYFLKQYKLRRVAEIKLFEFLVSLRYYVNTWPRAQQFALLCNISQCAVPSGEPQNVYKFDIYLQNFFFYVYNVLREQQSQYFEHDGFTYLPKVYILQVVKEISVIFNEPIKQKIQQKVDRSYKKVDDKEGLDIDKLIDIFIDEYFESKKKLHKIIAKNFSKAYENEHGVFNLDDMKKICKDILNEKSFINGSSYPKDISITRVFLYSLTVNKNKFDINAKEFMQSISKYGIDCPFPSIKTTNAYYTQKKQNQELNSSGNQGKKDKKGKDKKNQKQNEKKDLESLIKDFLTLETLSLDDLKPIINHFNIDIQQQSQLEEEKSNLKVDATSTLFAQHFSILRELRNYCKSFKENLAKEENPDVLWTEFGNIMSILDAGCQFLNFPINI